MIATGRRSRAGWGSAVAVGAALLAVVLSGCRGDGDGAGGEMRVVVLAASSLAGALEEVEVAFEAAHPEVDLQISHDGSANLATAILEGAPADVFAPADGATLQEVIDEGRVDGEGVVFVTNHLQIVVPEGNPRRITGLADLDDPGVALTLCREEVPCGEYARRAFDAAGLRVPPAGQEDSVRGVLTKVVLGEADAGLVYVTDVLAADGVEGVDLAEDEQVRATYPAAVLSDSPNPEAAAAFVAFLTGAAAQEILEAHGFGPP